MDPSCVKINTGQRKCHTCALDGTLKSLHQRLLGPYMEGSVVHNDIIFED